MRRWVLTLCLLGAPALCFAAATPPAGGSTATTSTLGTKTSILATSTVRLPPPQAALDSSYTLSLQANPYLSGTAANLRAPLQLSAVLLGATTSLDKIWYQSLIPVQSGRWSTTIFPSVPRGVYRLELRSAAALLSTSTLSIGLPTQPQVDADPSLPTYDVADGKLLHFKIGARGLGEVSIAQLTFDIEPTNATVDTLNLYVFGDSGYATSAVSSPDGLVASGDLDQNNHFVAVFDEPLVIRAGTTDYFELQGTVTPTDSNYQVASALIGDSNAATVDTESVVATSSNFVWSPDLRGEASSTDADWTNSLVALGLLGRGPNMVRTSTPGAAVCTLTLSTTSAQKGVSVTAGWTSSGASGATWGDGSAAPLQGSKTFANVQATQTYVLNFAGASGAPPATCIATVGIGTLVVVATTTVATTTTTVDTFVASSTVGSLKVGFGGTVNSSKSCAANTWSFGYGDRATSTINVGANTCAPVKFYFTRTYASAGTYLAILATSTGAKVSQVVHTKVIVVPTTATYSNAASVFGAITGVVYGFFSGMWDFILRSVPWR